MYQKIKNYLKNDILHLKTKKMKRIKNFLIKISLIPCKVKKLKNITILIYKNGNRKIIF